jgi:hypothetical protein
MEKHVTVKDTQESTARTSAGVDLSQQVFSDPQTFLRVLKDDVESKSDPYRGMSKNDLIAYSVSAENDPQARAAAAIAARHFDDLTNMARLPLVGVDEHNPVISARAIPLTRDAVQTIADLSQGNTQRYIEQNKHGNELEMFSYGAAAAAVGIPTAVISCMGPWSFALYGTPVAALMGYEALRSYGDLEAGAPKIQAWSKNDKATLASWTEINGASDA